MRVPTLVKHLSSAKNLFRFDKACSIHVVSNSLSPTEVRFVQRCSREHYNNSVIS